MSNSILKESVWHEIQIFEALHHGAFPEKIFLSVPMYERMQCEMECIAFRDKPSKLFGIPFEVYNSSDIEFYLAEKKGTFRKTLDEMNVFTMKRSDTNAE